ncbi:hypothetical protein [Halobacillus litoralis]|uniref:hypothetical protein n=1 Tax=Halobacillus litoralis TaxID=45668 RepID=UPI001CD4376C|nr:hypothetical protein [Halobacillus litoralis]MCA1021647.1 hypothetical protein [Halobacillus litoralis]
MSFIADVFDVTLIDQKTGEVFANTTLQDANIEFSLEENEIRGGRGNTLLGLLHSNRDIMINLTDTEFKYDWMARQMGTDIVTGAGVAYAAPQHYKVVDNAGTPEVSLSKTPVAQDSGLAVYTENGQQIDGATLSGGTIDFSSANPTVAADDLVEVRTYKYETAAETQTVEFDVKQYPSEVTAVLETIEIDGGENITHTIQYQFDRAVPQGNFTLNTSSSREASTQDFALKVIKPKESSKVGRALRIPYVETP